MQQEKEDFGDLTNLREAMARIGSIWHVLSCDSVQKEPKNVSVKQSDG